MELEAITLNEDNLNCAEPLFESNNSLNVHFNLSKKTVWIIHGYRPLGSTPAWLTKFTKTVLKHEDVNLIVVDWNQGATTFIYSRAVKNTRIVAEHLSLDPAGPKFSGKPASSRLDYTDAQFVDVIHTDSNGLGILEPLGHIDFYPNGGRNQPGCPTTLFSGVNYVKCDHQRAVHLFIAAFERNCHFISFPCRSHIDFENGLCVDCENLYGDTCPRLGNQALLWKEGLKKRMEGWPLRTTAFLDTSGRNPFCAYYFILRIVALNETMRNGSISLSLFNNFKEFEYPKLYMRRKPFENLQEVRILAQFIGDIATISCIYVTYSQSSDSYCPTCEYRFQSLVLKSLTHPE
ncbi:hypothetical protein STEG23_023455, partial [Scotinomys teguina]